MTGSARGLFLPESTPELQPDVRIQYSMHTYVYAYIYYILKKYIDIDIDIYISLSLVPPPLTPPSVYIYLDLYMYVYGATDDWISARDQRASSCYPSRRRSYNLTYEYITCIWRYR